LFPAGSKPGIQIKTQDATRKFAAKSLEQFSSASFLLLMANVVVSAEAIFSFSISFHRWSFALFITSASPLDLSIDFRYSWAIIKNSKGEN
jgi:hypothetical protein